MDKKTTAKAILCAVLGNIIWGFSFLFTRIGLDFVPNPNILLSHRFLISSFCMLVWILMGKEKVSFKGKHLKPILLLLLLQVLYYVFESYGVLYTNTTISGLVLATVPVVTLGTGALFLKEYPTTRQALFCILPVVGVIMMTVSGSELGVLKPIGLLFLCLTLLSSAFYKTVNRTASADFTAFERTFLVLSVSSLSFTVAGLSSVNFNVAEYAAPLLHWQYLFSVLGLSVFSSIGANMLVNYAVDKMSVFKLASFGSLSTLCSVFAGVVFLHEPLSWGFVIGAVLILVGVHQVNRGR